MDESLSCSPGVCSSQMNHRGAKSTGIPVSVFSVLFAVLSVRTAHFEQDCLCKCSKPAPPGTWLFSRTKRKLPHICLICVHLRHLRLRSFCSAFWLWLRRTKSLRLTPLVIRVALLRAADRRALPSLLEKSNRYTLRPERP